MSGELITGPQQVQWRNVVIGDAGRKVLLSGLKGWLDSPDMRNSDSDRPGRHGQFMGQMLASGRTIEVDFTILDSSMLTAMRAAPIPDENPIEEDLVIWAGYDVPLIVQARCQRWTMPTDAQWAAGYNRGTFQFKCTDPRKYGLTLQTATTTMPIPAGSGLPFPLAFPLKFGPPATGGFVTVLNRGNAAVWPVFVIGADIAAPIISDLGSGRRIVFDGGTLGQSIVVDTETRQVSRSGVTARPDVITAQWFALAPGVPQRIGFSSGYEAYSDTGTLTVQWRDAYL